MDVFNNSLATMQMNALSALLPQTGEYLDEDGGIWEIVPMGALPFMLRRIVGMFLYIYVYMHTYIHISYMFVVLYVLLYCMFECEYATNI
jgi:hypothetical protein